MMRHRIYKSAYSPNFQYFRNNPGEREWIALGRCLFSCSLGFTFLHNLPVRIYLYLPYKRIYTHYNNCIIIPTSVPEVKLLG